MICGTVFTAPSAWFWKAQSRAALAAPPPTRRARIQEQPTDCHRTAYVAACEHAGALYAELLAADWPRELARMVLPVSTYSRMFATMNLLNCFRFLALRDDAHAQHEIRVYASAMLELLAERFPVCVAAFQESR